MGERTFIIERARIAIKISQMKIIEIDTSAAPVGKYRKSKRDQREIARREKEKSGLRLSIKGKKIEKKFILITFLCASELLGRSARKLIKGDEKRTFSIH